MNKVCQYLIGTFFTRLNFCLDKVQSNVQKCFSRFVVYTTQLVRYTVRILLFSNLLIVKKYNMIKINIIVLTHKYVTPIGT